MITTLCQEVANVITLQVWFCIREAGRFFRAWYKMCIQQRCFFLLNAVFYMHIPRMDMYDVEESFILGKAGLLHSIMM